MKELIEVFYEPGKVFDAVRERRIWVAPFLAGILLTVILIIYATNTIGGGNIMRQQLEGSKFAANMPEEQKEKAIADADRPAVIYRNSAIGAVGIAIFTLLIAGLVLGVAAIGGGKISLAQALGTISYASWPITVVRSVLSMIVLIVATDKSVLNPQTLLAFNAGAFLDKNAVAKPLFALATAIDLFIFAQIYLTAFGIARVAHISFTKALIGLLVIWAAFTVLGMGLSVLF